MKKILNPKLYSSKDHYFLPQDSESDIQKNDPSQSNYEIVENSKIQITNYSGNKNVKIRIEINHEDFSEREYVQKPGKWKKATTVNKMQKVKEPNSQKRFHYKQMQRNVERKLSQYSNGGYSTPKNNPEYHTEYNYTMDVSQEDIKQYSNNVERQVFSYEKRFHKQHIYHPENKNKRYYNTQIFSPKKVKEKVQFQNDYSTGQKQNHNYRRRFQTAQSTKLDTEPDNRSDTYDSIQHQASRIDTPLASYNQFKQKPFFASQSRRQMKRRQSEKERFEDEQNQQKQSQRLSKIFIREQTSGDYLQSSSSKKNMQRVYSIQNYGSVHSQIQYQNHNILGQQQEKSPFEQIQNQGSQSGSLPQSTYKKSQLSSEVYPNNLHSHDQIDQAETQIKYQNYLQNSQIDSIHRQLHNFQYQTHQQQPHSKNQHNIQLNSIQKFGLQRIQEYNLKQQKKTPQKQQQKQYDQSSSQINKHQAKIQQQIKNESESSLKNSQMSEIQKLYQFQTLQQEQKQVRNSSFPSPKQNQSSLSTPRLYVADQAIKIEQIQSQTQNNVVFSNYFAKEQPEIKEQTDHQPLVFTFSGNKQNIIDQHQQKKSKVEIINYRVQQTKHQSENLLTGENLQYSSFQTSKEQQKKKIKKQKSQKTPSRSTYQKIEQGYLNRSRSKSKQNQIPFSKKSKAHHHRQHCFQPVSPQPFKFKDYSKNQKILYTVQPASKKNADIRTSSSKISNVSPIKAPKVVRINLENKKAEDLFTKHKNQFLNKLKAKQNTQNVHSFLKQNSKQKSLNKKINSTKYQIKSPLNDTKKPCISQQIRKLTERLSSHQSEGICQHYTTHSRRQIRQRFFSLICQDNSQFSKQYYLSNQELHDIFAQKILNKQLNEDKWIEIVRKEGEKKLQNIKLRSKSKYHPNEKTIIKIQQVIGDTKRTYQNKSPNFKHYLQKTFLY